MPGTLLLDDYRQSVEDQLKEHAQGLGQAFQVIGNAVPQGPDPQQVLQELQSHAQQAAEQTQTGITQFAQQRQQQVADVGQQLQDYAQSLGASQPQPQPLGTSGVTQFAQPQPQPQQPPPSPAQPDVLGGASPTQTPQQVSTSPAATSGLGPIDNSSPSAFARSFAPYAQYAAQKLGVDPTWVAAMAGSESNYGKAGGNELFGVKALPGQPGTTMQTHEGEYGGTTQNATFASYDTPKDAVDAWVNLIQNHYKSAVGAQDLPTFIHGLKQGGYFTAAEPEYLGIVKGIGDRIGGDVQAGLQGAGQAIGGAASAVGTRAQQAYQDISQFGDSQLSNAESYAACGPAAAVRFAERFGRNPTLREAVDLAKQVGWTEAGGMAGIGSEQSLLQKLGVPTSIVQGAQWDRFGKEAQTGNPVTISTPGHYFYADGYDPSSGAFHVGRSGTDLKGGSEWMTPAQMEGLMGGAQGALFADNPTVPSASPESSPAYTVGGQRPATRAPMYAGVMQPAAGEPERAPFQVIGDTVGQVVSDLGAAARGALPPAGVSPHPLPGQPGGLVTPPGTYNPPPGSLGGAAAGAARQTIEDVGTAARQRVQQGQEELAGGARAAGGAVQDFAAGAQQAAAQVPTLAELGRDVAGLGAQVPEGIPLVSGAAPVVTGIVGGLIAQPGVLDSMATVQRLNAKYATSAGATSIPDRAGGPPLVLYVDPSVMSEEDRAAYTNAMVVVGSMSGPQEVRRPLEGARPVEAAPGIARPGVPEPVTNPYELPTAPSHPTAAPLSGDEVLSHLEYLDQLHTQNDARIAELQNRLAAGGLGRGETAGTVVRPPWAAGWTNAGLEEVARRNDLNPYEPLWWERGNLVPGTGEMRENVGQSGVAGGPGYRGTKLTQQTPTEMRAELGRLQAEQTHLETAQESIWGHVDQGGDVYGRPTPEALPFDRGGPDTGATQAGAGPARATAPTPRGGGEAPSGISETRTSPELAAPIPATVTQPELTGIRPRATEPAAPGGAPPRPPVPPTRGPGGPTPPGGSSPELDRLNAMFDGKKPAAPSSVADRIQAVGDSLTRAFTDRQVDINRAQERYAANLGRPLRGDEMAAELQRLASDPAAQVKVDEGLKPAIQSVGADYPSLRNYVTLRSNVEVADNLARRTGKPDVATERQFSGGLTRDESAKALQDLETQLGPDRFARVQAAADQVTAFNNTLRQRLVDGGVLDANTAANLEAQYPNWAKTRILDYMADPSGGQGAGTKLGLNDRGLREYTLAGTTKAREDPIASTVAYAHQVERMAMKNEAFNAFLNIDQAGETPMLRQVPQSYTPTKNEVSMIGFVDGQKQKYVTDNKALGEAINGAGVLSTPEWTSAWQKVFRSLATSRNPVFLAGNAALDIPTYVLRQSVRAGGPQAMPRILYELARGYADAFQGLLQGEYRGAGTAAYLKGGGGQAGYFTGGEGASKQAIAEMQRKNVFQINGSSDLARLTKDILTLHPVEALGERIELGPRVAAMRLAERRGANPTQAVIDGRTVTIDFSQGGTVTKYLNNFIPFFNVGFQGPAQVARAFRENKGAFVATVGTLIGTPSVAAEVWNRSDPQRAKDYADVPEYVKDQGIVVMLPGDAEVDKQGNRKPLYAVVKLREWAPFAAVAREATARAMGDDTRSVQDMAQSIGAGLSPTSSTSLVQAGTEPLAGIPILPAAAQLEMNKDFFRNRTIVSQRADENASALSKTLAPQLQAVLDRAGVSAEIRPSAIDFLIRNQGAGVGGAVLGAGDLAAGEPSNAVGPTGAPIVGGLAGRFVGSQTGDALQQARDQTLTSTSRQILRSNGITITPGAVSASVNQIPLKLDEETRYQQLANRYIDEAIQRTAASSDFATKTQVGKQSMIDQAMQGARAKAGNEVLNTIPADEKRRRLRTKSTAA